MFHTPKTNVVYTICYSKEGRLLRDFAKLSFFSKESKAPRKRHARIMVNVDKPFVLTSMKTKQHVMVNGHYTFTNEHGYSFEALQENSMKLSVLL